MKYDVTPGIKMTNGALEAIEANRLNKTNHSLSGNGNSYHFTDSMLSKLKLSLNLSIDTSFEAVKQELLRVINLQLELKQLKIERAELTVEKYINIGMVPVDKRDYYIKLATVDLSITIDMINEDFQKRNDLQSLLKLSGRELYLSGQFDRLRQVNTPVFLARHKEYFGFEYVGQ